jgi:LacI family transcriptional regulator
MVLTIREVAEAAGVSQATASRALGGYGSVSSAAAARVLEAAEKLGYRTNRVAQALRSGQMRTVGFIPGDLENPFFAKIARHLGDALESEGYVLLVSSSAESAERERKIIDTFLAHMLSGVVIAPTAQQSAPHLDRLVSDGVPLVLVDRLVGGVRADSVTTNNEEAGRQAVAHLIECGHRRIAIVSDNLQITSTSERFTGYQRALSDAGLPLDPRLLGVGDSSRESARTVAARLLAMPDRPTAVFTTDNFMTEGVLQAIREAGLSVPTDVSLVGFDDFPETSFIDPAITVVAQPIAEMGEEAARLLLARLRGDRSAPHRVNLVAELIVRNSTAAPLAQR